MDRYKVVARDKGWRTTHDVVDMLSDKQAEYSYDNEPQALSKCLDMNAEFITRMNLHDSLFTIGNLVMVTGKVRLVTSCHNVSTVSLNEDNTACGFSMSSDVEGIPLVIDFAVQPEALELVAKVNEDSDAFWTTYVGNHTLEVKPSGIDHLRVRVKNGTTYKVRYVHELQTIIKTLKFLI